MEVSGGEMLLYMAEDCFEKEDQQVTSCHQAIYNERSLIGEFC